MTKKTNPKSPWRSKYGGLGPLSKQDPLVDECKEHIAGVLDVEFFETPAHLTMEELEELL